MPKTSSDPAAPFPRADREGCPPGQRPRQRPSRRPRRPFALALALPLAACCALSGCAAFDDGAGRGGQTGRGDAAASDDAARRDGDLKAGGRPVVLATFSVIADMAKNVGAGHVEVVSLVKPGAELHEYEPTPSDARLASRADLVLENGLHLEAWLDRLLQGTQAARVTLTEGIEPIGIADTTESNPHAWMSPTLGLHYVDRIEAALIELAPEHRDEFRANADRYRAQLREVRDELATTLAGAPAPSSPAEAGAGGDSEGTQAPRATEMPTLVTCEGAFSYLTRDFGLGEAYLWPVNSDGEVTPRQVAGVIERVRAERIPAVFCESTVNDQAMRQVVESTGARFGGVLYVDSLSGADGPVPTYLDLLRHDARLIAQLASDERAEAAPHTKRVRP